MKPVGADVKPLELAREALAGREAWLVGGGENAQVVYSRPR